MSGHYGSRRPMTMAQAAKALVIGRNVLFALLRRQRAFVASNLPHPMLLRAGLFRVETRGFIHPGCGRQMQYQRVTVTDEGLFWLRELIRADREGKAAPPVGGRDFAAAVAGATAGGAATDTGALAGNGENTSRERLGAAREQNNSR